MYKAGDRVVYKNNGICVIEDIRKEKFGTQEKQDYYVLKLLYTEDARIYVPVEREEKEGKMRAPITKEIAREVIEGYKSADEYWIFDDKLRAARFKDVLDAAEPMELARLVKSLEKKSSELLGAGKRLRVSDDAVFKKAEANLYGELAAAFDVSVSDVKQLLI